MPAAYDHVVKAIGVPASRIVFFDDLAENIEGARARGLTAVHVTSPDDVATHWPRSGSSAWDLGGFARGLDAGCRCAVPRSLRAPSRCPKKMVALDAAHHRVLARDVAARRTQPPQAMSAMDGYAVRAADAADLAARLKVIGEVAAGRPFERKRWRRRSGADLYRRRDP